MSKKIMLVIVAVILLLGAENLIAQERRDRPEAEPERVRALQQKPQQKPVREAVRKRVEAVRGKLQQLRPEQEASGRLLDELTKAYRENDREKMGQLIRKMNQLRQRVQKARVAPGERVRDLRGRPEAAQPGAKKERPERRKATPEDTDRLGPPMLRRGTGRWGQGMQGRGIGGRGQGMQGRGMGRRGQGFQGRGMGRWGQGMQGRGMGGRGQGFQGRGMGGLGRGFQGRGMGGLGRGFQGRGMGGWGRGVPGPWCPWWSVPGPETD